MTALPTASNEAVQAIMKHMGTLGCDLGKKFAREARQQEILIMDPTFYLVGQSLARAMLLSAIVALKHSEELLKDPHVRKAIADYP